MIRQSVRVILVLSLMTLTACSVLSKSQKQHTLRFAQATADLGQISRSEFQNIRREIIDMNTRRVILDRELRPEMRILEGAITTQTLTVRMAAADTLQQYGNLLQLLVSSEPREDLQRAAADLLDSASAVLGDKLSSEIRSGLDKTIISLGSIWIERERAVALKSIVTQFQKPVEDLADLLIQDLSIELGSAGVMMAYHNTAGQLKNLTLQLLSSEEDDFEKRQYLVMAHAQAESARVRAAEIHQLAQQALLEFKKANREIVGILQGDESVAEGIDLYIVKIKQLTALYEVVSY